MDGPGLVVIVSGGREWRDAGAVTRVLTLFHAKRGIAILIQGGARGVDAFAKAWAKANAVHCAEVPALWHAHKNAAGPIRNRAMLRLKPDGLIAFPGGHGTADMIAAASAAGVPVWQPLRDA